MPAEKSSTALNPGTIIPVAVGSTPIFDDDDLDLGLVVIFQNSSDEYITVRPAVNGAVPFAGVTLAPGGTWREENLATAVCACHHGSAGNKNLTVIVF